MADWYADKIIKGHGPLGKEITFSRTCATIRKKYSAKESEKLIKSIKTILINKGHMRLLSK